MSEEYQSDQTWIIDVPILSTRDEWRVSESDQTWIIDVPILSTRDEWRVSESDQMWIIDVPILSTRDEWRVSESDQTWIIDDEWRPIQIHFNLVISTSDVSADKLFYWITRSKNMV
jgi:hypothetical protein